MRRPVQSREVQLLFCFLDTAMDDRAAIELIESGIDWRFFGWLLNHERAAPVVQRRLSALPAGVVPGPVSAALARMTLVTEFRMSRLEERLDETLVPLRAAGIDVILLKGAGLASTVYPSFNLRPMGDLDILVKEERATEAWELVRQAGWLWDHQEDLDRFYKGHHHFPPLDDAGGTGFGLELHTGLFPAGHPFELSYSYLWESAEPVPLRGEGVYVLEHHAQMLHLCLHFAWSHTMRSASWRTCQDLSVLLRTGKTDWDRFVDLATSARAATASYWTLRLARGLMGLEVPDRALALLAPSGSEIVLKLLERHYLLHLTPTLAGCPSSRADRLLWECGVRPGASGHGERRPWDRNALFVGDPAAGVRRESSMAEGAGGGGATIAAEGSATDTAAASIGGGIGTRLWSRFGQVRDWWRYLGMISGLTAGPSSRTAASRRATASKRGRSASASSESTLPAR